MLESSIKSRRDDIVIKVGVWIDGMFGIAISFVGNRRVLYLSFGVLATLLPRLVKSADVWILLPSRMIHETWRDQNDTSIELDNL